MWDIMWNNVTELFWGAPAPKVSDPGSDPKYVISPPGKPIQDVQSFDPKKYQV